MKGYPLHVVVDTYEDLENESAEPVHRAYCRVKIFRDKVWREREGGRERGRGREGERDGCQRAIVLIRRERRERTKTRPRIWIGGFRRS